MNNEQKDNVSGMSENSAPVNNPTPSAPENKIEGMTTAVVNPNFMEEVETPVSPLAPASNIAPQPIVQPPIVPEPPKVEPEQPVKKKGINKVVLIVIIVVVAVLLAIGGYVAYLFLGVDPKKVHDEIIDQMFSSADNFASKLMVANYNYDAKTIKSSSTLSFNTSIEQLSELNNYSFKIDSGLDKENNYANCGLAVLEKNKELLNLNYYLINNKAYFESKKLYDQVIEIGDFELSIKDMLEIYELLDSDKLTHLLDTLKKGFENSFNDDKYNRSLETVKLDGKEVKAFNNSYVFGEADLYGMIENILTTIKSDEESIQTIVDYVNKIYSAVSNGESGELTKDDVISLIDTLIQMVTDPELSGSDLKVYFNVYSNIVTNDVIGAKLILERNSSSITLVEYSVDGDTSKLKLGVNDKDADIFYIEITTKGNKSDINVMSEGESILTGTMESSETKASLSLSLNTETLGIADQISDITFSINSEIVDNATNMEMKAAINTGDKSYDFSMMLNNEISYDESISKPNVLNAIPLAEVDEQKVRDNLTSILKGSGLYEILGSDLGLISDDEYYGVYLDSDDGEDEYEYSENCDEATDCDCDGDVCECTYLRNGWKSETIICPNPNI